MINKNTSKNSINRIDNNSNINNIDKKLINKLNTFHIIDNQVNQESLNEYSKNSNAKNFKIINNKKISNVSNSPLIVNKINYSNFVGNNYKNKSPNKTFSNNQRGRSKSRSNDYTYGNSSNDFSLNNFKKNTNFTPSKYSNKPIKIQMNISDYKKRKFNTDYDTLYNYNNNTGYKYDTSPYGTSNKYDTATNTKTGGTQLGSSSNFYNSTNNISNVFNKNMIQMPNNQQQQDTINLNLNLNINKNQYESNINKLKTKKNSLYRNFNEDSKNKLFNYSNFNNNQEQRKTNQTKITNQNKKTNYYTTNQTKKPFQNQLDYENYREYNNQYLNENNSGIINQNTDLSNYINLKKKLENVNEINIRLQKDKETNFQNKKNYENKEEYISLYEDFKRLKNKQEMQQMIKLKDIQRSMSPDITPLAKNITRDPDRFVERLYPYYKLGNNNHIQGKITGYPESLQDHFERKDNIQKCLDDNEMMAIYGNTRDFEDCIYRKLPKNNINNDHLTFTPSLDKNSVNIAKKFEPSFIRLTTKRSKSKTISNSKNNSYLNKMNKSFTSRCSRDFRDFKDKNNTLSITKTGSKTIISPGKKLYEKGLLSLFKKLKKCEQKDHQDQNKYKDFSYKPKLLQSSNQYNSQYNLRKVILQNNKDELKEENLHNERLEDSNFNDSYKREKKNSNDLNDSQNIQGVYGRNLLWKNYVENKVNKSKDKISKEEIQACTFTPEIINDKINTDEKIIKNNLSSMYEYIQRRRSCISKDKEKKEYFDKRSNYNCKQIKVNKIYTTLTPKSHKDPIRDQKNTPKKKESILNYRNQIKSNTSFFKNEHHREDFEHRSNMQQNFSDSAFLNNTFNNNFQNFHENQNNEFHHPVHYLNENNEYENYNNHLVHDQIENNFQNQENNNSEIAIGYHNQNMNNEELNNNNRNYNYGSYKNNHYNKKFKNTKKIIR